MSGARESLVIVKALMCLEIDLRGMSVNELCEMEEGAISPWPNVGRSYKDEKIVDLIEASKTDAVAFDALRKLSALIIDCGDPVPVSLREWLLGRIQGTVLKPTRRGQSRWKNFSRDMKICRALSDLKAKGVDVYKNRSPTVSTRAIKSGSQIVGETFGMTAPAVEAVWEKYAHMR